MWKAILNVCIELPLVIKATIISKWLWASMLLYSYYVYFLQQTEHAHCVHVLEQERKQHFQLLFSFLRMGGQCGFVDDFQTTPQVPQSLIWNGCNWHVWKVHNFKATACHRGKMRTMNPRSNHCGLLGMRKWMFMTTLLQATLYLK